MSPACGECPCFNLGVAHRRVARAFETELAPLGLTIAQAHCLSCLFAEDARLSKDVARELNVDAGTLTPMIDRLVRQGWVRRCPKDDDRRAVRLCLTEAALGMRWEIEARCRRASERLRGRFTPEEFDTFARVLSALAEEPPTSDAAHGETGDPTPSPIRV